MEFHEDIIHGHHKHHDKCHDNDYCCGGKCHEHTHYVEENLLLFRQQEIQELLDKINEITTGGYTVVSGEYDHETKDIILTKNDGSTVEFSLQELYDALQEKITPENRLNADLIINGEINKFITDTERLTWNNKQDLISDLNTIRSNSQDGKTAYDTIQTYGDIVTHNAEDFVTPVNLNGYQTKITSSNKLSTDLLQEGNKKLVTNEEKVVWSGKQERILDLETIRQNAQAGKIAADAAANYGNLVNYDFEDLPEVTDKKITIQRNGVTIGTFTTNSTTDTTINVDVPTKVSSLTNDAGYITSITANNTFAKNSDLATVAKTGSYNDLKDKPTDQLEQVNSDWNATSGKAEILNKPNIPTKVSDLTNDENFVKQTDLMNFVPASRKINNKTLTDDVSLTANDVGALSNDIKYGKKIDLNLNQHVLKVNLKDQDNTLLDSSEVTLPTSAVDYIEGPPEILWDDYTPLDKPVIKDGKLIVSYISIYPDPNYPYGIRPQNGAILSGGIRINIGLPEGCKLYVPIGVSAFYKYFEPHVYGDNFGIACLNKDEELYTPDAYHSGNAIGLHDYNFSNFINSAPDAISEAIQTLPEQGTDINEFYNYTVQIDENHHVSISFEDGQYQDAVLDVQSYGTRKSTDFVYLGGYEASTGYNMDLYEQAENVLDILWIDLNGVKITDSEDNVVWSMSEAKFVSDSTNVASKDKPDIIVERWNNGINGYEIYSSGFCRQWGRYDTNTTGTINLIVPMKHYILFEQDMVLNPGEWQTQYVHIFIAEGWVKE